MDILQQYQRILAIAQSGKAFGKDHFDQERYEELEQISLELISQLGNEPLEHIQDLFSGETGYPTPKIDVRGFCRNAKGQILLVQDQKTKKWSLPGGFGEIGLTPKENIQKEIFEETGFEVEIQDLLAVFDTNQKGNVPQSFQYYKLIFACQLLEGTFKANNEVSCMAFFGMDAMPPLSKKRTTKEQLMILLHNNSKTYVD